MRFTIRLHRANRSAAARKPPPTIVLVAASLAFTSIVLVFDALVISQLVQQVHAQRTFATTEGVVTASNVESSHGMHRSGPMRIVSLAYTYAVDGREYAGDRYAYGEWSSNDGRAARIADEFPVGASVTVYYDPDDPRESALAVGVGGTQLILLALLLPFNLLVPILAWAAVRGVCARSPRSSLHTDSAAPKA